jgi:hypothetical protein
MKERKCVSEQDTKEPPPPKETKPAHALKRKISAIMKLNLICHNKNKIIHRILMRYYRLTSKSIVEYSR